jgi:hypothetical protein
MLELLDPLPPLNSIGSLAPWPTHSIKFELWTEVVLELILQARVHLTLKLRTVTPQEPRIRTRTLLPCPLRIKQLQYGR